MNAFDGTGQGQQADPFGAAPDVSNYPNANALRGKLLLVTPTRLETGLLSSFSKPGNPQYQDRITANVIVLDGLPIVSEKGQVFDTNEFTGMYFSQSRLVAQLSGNVGTGRAILGRLETYKPGEEAKAGNPWGLMPMTEQDAALARAYLAGDRSMIPAAPVQQAPASPWAQQAPAAQAPAQAPAAQVPANPWMNQQGQAPANPWAQPQQ